MVECSCCYGHLYSVSPWASLVIPTINGKTRVGGHSCDLILKVVVLPVANCVQDEQQIKHYREDTARMREQIAELQTR